VGLIVVRADRERPLPSRTVGLVLMCALAAVWVASGLSPRMSVGGRPNASYGRGWGALPTRAREAVSARLGADERSFTVSRVAAGVLVARGGGLHSAFGVGGVRASTGTGTALRLGLSALGRAGRLRSVAPVAPVWRGNRVIYARGGVGEWYANGPVGLEQGFTLLRRPSGSGILRLAVGSLPAGVRARLAVGGESLAVVDRAGRSTLTYGELTVTDAIGRHLRAWIRLADRQILIRVDDAGARYPITIDPLVQEVELSANDGAASDFFGTSVAISGSTIVAGAPYHGASAQGAVYVFTETANGGWQQSAELTASDGDPGDNLGSSVAISNNGDTVVAGAPGHEVDSRSGQGAVYVFAEPATGWATGSQTAELTADDGAVGDNLGASVAVSERTIVAGAPSHTGDGAVYVFTQQLGVWASSTQTAELTASDGGAGDNLGSSVTISSDSATVMAGAPDHTVASKANEGAAYVFSEPAGGWVSSDSPTELHVEDGAAGDEFGFSVGIANGTVVVGAPSHASAGTVYVFSGSATAWKQTAELTAADGASGDDLGASVAIDGGTVVAGAPYHQVNANQDQGALYVFSEPATGWASGSQTAELTASDGAANDTLGSATELSGSTIVAGAPERDVGPNSEAGSIYVFGPGTLVPVIQTPPTITGSATAGQTLIESHGSWTNNPIAYNYHWEDCDSSGESCSAIAGATGQSYTLTTADVGHAIEVLETAANVAGLGSPASSAPTGVVSSIPSLSASSPAAIGSSGAAFSGSVDPDGLATSVHFEYGLDPRYSAGGPLVYDQSTPVVAVGSDFVSHSVSASVTGLVPNALYHVRLVASNSAGVTTGSDQTFTTAQGALPPPPTIGQTVDLTPVSGLVLVKPPSGTTLSGALAPAARGALAIGQGFVPLTEARQLPIGSEVDARRGTLRLTTSLGKRDALQAGTFAGALFKVAQTRSGLQKGLTTISLIEGAFPGAPSYSGCPAAAPADAFALEAARLSTRVLQLLRASDNHGRFRTSGRFSSATVRGTVWEMADRCDGTVTSVRRGTVDVTDFATRKTIAVHAGHSYLAKAIVARKASDRSR
jgi:hypothetical protein